MSKWLSRKKNIGEDLDFDPLKTIPMLENMNNTNEEMEKRIKQEFDNGNVSAIYIIDQYLQASDLEFIIRSFASIRSRKITLITKLEDHRSGLKKTSSEELFKKAKYDIEAKGIFSNLEIYKTTLPIHDRYIFSYEDNSKSLFFSLGTSINMLFDHHTSIIRIDNNSLKRKIVRLKEKCIEEGYEIGSENER